VASGVFADRADAGRRLAVLLEPFRDSRPVVVGMARGGVAVAAPVADALGAVLDVVVVRKLGHPGQPELGLGAIGEEGVRIVNEPLVQRLGVSAAVIDEVARRETAELERRRTLYRAGRPPVTVAGRPVVVVDDGLATGFTARAAVEVMRRRRAGRVVVAVSVGSPRARAALEAVADEVVCVETADDFFGISEWYRDFHQVSDDEVARLLQTPGP
jgi:predicted phosphoribosyltransferase